MYVWLLTTLTFRFEGLFDLEHTRRERSTLERRREVAGGQRRSVRRPVAFLERDRSPEGTALFARLLRQYVLSAPLTLRGVLLIEART